MSTRINGGGMGVWVNHNGEQIDPPEMVKVIRVNRMGGSTVAVWFDPQTGLRINDPTLPKPTLDMVGFTATPNGMGGWIYGGENSQGTRPRGLDHGGGAPNPSG